MQIDRAMLSETVSNASQTPIATLASRLGRTSDHPWGKTRGEGVIVLAATGLTCALSAILAQAALAQAAGLVVA